MLDAGDGRGVDKTALYTRKITVEREKAVIQQMIHSLIHYNHCKCYTQNKECNKTLRYFCNREEINRGYL